MPTGERRRRRRCPGFGTLAGRIDEAPPGDYAAVLNDTDVQGYADIREHRAEHHRAGSWPETVRPINLDRSFRRCSTACSRGLRRTHNVILVDTSDDLEHPVAKAVLDSCDTLVFVSGLTADTSLPVTRSIDLLRSMGYHEPVSRSMVIINDSRNGYDKDALAYLTERYSQSGATVEYMPMTRISRPAASSTRHMSCRKEPPAPFEITAALADKYVPDADRPR